ncbi:MAG: methyltransferase domain-containing protein, partial [Anaerolineae bacterium]|nr:methyltransferase domain-containing protein [Anaerolineae bacterium]
SGLSEDELDLLAALPNTTGDLLLLGVGGGREAIALARMGFHVTGVDYVAAMVDRARENAARRGVSIEGLVQEISRLEVQEGAYDVVWISRSMYSCVPTRARRVEMVRRIARALRPGGYFLCQFYWDPRFRSTGMGELLRRVVAACTLGNLAHEAGDMLWGKIEFIHAFASEETIVSELEGGGLSVVSLQTDQASIRGGAVCRKNLEIDQNPLS